LANESDQVGASALLELRNNRELLESHLINLPAGESRTRGNIDPHLAIARAKIEDAENFDEALGYLTARETFAVLNSPTMLRAVCALPISAPIQVGQDASRPVAAERAGSPI
jgi:membrane glycosyltransferase